MRFHLVYHGALEGSGNKSKPDQVRDIRDHFHPQLKYLWETHSALKRLRQTAIVKKNPGGYLATPDGPSIERDIDIYPARDDEIDLCGAIEDGSKKYLPLVRKSLQLNCTLSINFLRQEDPGSLILQGGDVDNRIKMLFDALRKPDVDIEARFPQAQETTYCLMESDTLVSGFQVDTDRLLFPKTERPNEVHLLIEVKVNVLRVGTWNICLL